MRGSEAVQMKDKLIGTYWLPCDGPHKVVMARLMLPDALFTDLISSPSQP